MRLTLLEGRRWWLGKRVDGFRKNDDTHVGLGVSGADQLHPNESGCAKTTALLLNFFKSNEATRTWLLKKNETPSLTTLPLE